MNEWIENDTWLAKVQQTSHTPHRLCQVFDVLLTATLCKASMCLSSSAAFLKSAKNCAQTVLMNKYLELVQHASLPDHQPAAYLVCQPLLWLLNLTLVLKLIPALAVAAGPQVQTH